MQRSANQSRQANLQARHGLSPLDRSNAQSVGGAAPTRQFCATSQGRAPPATAPEIIRAHLQIINRQKPIIVLTGLLVVLLAIVFVATRKPLYSATTRIQIEQQATQIDEHGTVIYATPRSPRDLHTQHQLLTSRSLARRIATRLNLIHDQEFLAQSRRVSWLSGASQITSPNVEGTTNDNQSLEHQALELLLRHRRIRPIAGSRLVDIAYSDADPRRAKHIADAFADAFVASNMERRKWAAAVSKSQFERQVTHARKRLRNSERLLLAFAARQDASADVEVGEVTKNGIMEANAALASLTAVPFHSKRQRSQTNRMQGVTPAGVSRPLISSNPAIRAFEKMQSTHYDMLRRNVETNRTLYDRLLQRYNEIDHTTSYGINEISIVDRAVVPSRPTTASIAQILLVSLASGLGLGLAIAYIRDAVRDRLCTPEDVERRLAIPVLTNLPKFRSTNSVLPQLADPSKPLSEACRTLATTLQDQCDLISGRIVCVSSTGPGEGKSTIAFGLARQTAFLGGRVLLIDSDLGNPTLHKFLFQRNATGLSDYLAANIEPRNLIKSTDLHGLAFLPAGQVDQNPSRLLASPGLHALFNGAAKVFDLVIVDATSLTGGADVQLIRRAGAHLLLVIAANQVTAAELRCTLRHHSPTTPPIIGTIFNKYGRHSIHHRRALRPSIRWPQPHLAQ